MHCRRSRISIGPGAQPRTQRVPWDDTIIYELHVRGYTKLHPRVPPNLHAALIAGWAPKQWSNYIKSLGVTTVELMPIHTFINDSHLARARA